MKSSRTGRRVTRPRRSGRAVKRGPEIVDVLRRGRTYDVGRCLALTLIPLTAITRPTRSRRISTPHSLLYRAHLHHFWPENVPLLFFYLSRVLARTACPSLSAQGPVEGVCAGLGFRVHSLPLPSLPVLSAVSCYTRHFQCTYPCVARPVLVGVTQVKLTRRRTGHSNQ